VQTTIGTARCGSRPNRRPNGRVRADRGRRSAVRDPFVALIGASQHDASLAAALRERFVANRRKAAKDVLARGIERGELRADLDLDLDLDVAIDALYGALHYRLFVSGARLTPRYADTLLDQLYAAFAAR
jgi:hypothetical protein